MKYIFYFLTLLAEILLIAVITSMHLSVGMIIIVIFSAILVLCNLFVNITYNSEKIDTFYIVYEWIVASFQYDSRTKLYEGRIINIPDLQQYIMTADSRTSANKAFLDILDKEGLLDEDDQES